MAVGNAAAAAAAAATAAAAVAVAGCGCHNDRAGESCAYSGPLLHSQEDRGGANEIERNHPSL